MAGDISPMDVLSHLPVLCEEASVPYLFTPSRVELGLASSTKRPTSCLLIAAPGTSTSGAKGTNPAPSLSAEEENEYAVDYADLVKEQKALMATA
jgi:H/ACA ribonucleoprotein complex subunit 2